ncbi:MAG: hypothetical protein LBL90_12315 [Prevotellaceae bacterium]|jgi:predicted GNAT family N-acyltransferase|nr:hypothetical protein [Prevotellaceae bacterium]
MKKLKYAVGKTKPDEFGDTGLLTIRVYPQLDGFPKETEQPDYYKMLANNDELTKNKELNCLLQLYTIKNSQSCSFYQRYAVLWFRRHGHLRKNAAGFRLLAVDTDMRGQNTGKALIIKCIEKVKALGPQQVIIHTTKAMQTA